MNTKLNGLVAATHIPFQSDYQLNATVAEKQAEHLLRNGVNIVSIGGSTGESHSLTVAELLALAHRWSEVVCGTIIHIGSNCLSDARAMVSQAQTRFDWQFAAATAFSGADHDQTSRILFGQPGDSPSRRLPPAPRPIN